MSDIRIDRVKLGKIKKTANGFLTGIAPVTRTGVFVYSNMDGTERRELRHPDDVYAEKSLNSLKSLPITNDHPKKLVDVDNADTVLVGMTGETINVEDGFVNASLTITNKDTIAAINAGKRELSAGYKVELIPEVGEYNGEKYTHRQTNIDYNHISLVDIGRAGPLVRLNLDGAFVQCEEIKEKQEVMTIKKDNDAESLIEELAQTVNKETDKTEVSKTEKDIEKVQKAADAKIAELETSIKSNNDSLQSTIDKLRSENEELKKINLDSLIVEKVKLRTALLSKASAVINVDSLVDKNEREIMEAVIQARSNANLDFADKSYDYVLGRFDSAMDELQLGIFKKQITNLDAKTSEPEVTTLLGYLKKQQNSAV